MSINEYPHQTFPDAESAFEHLGEQFALHKHTSAWCVHYPDRVAVYVNVCESDVLHTPLKRDDYVTLYIREYPDAHIEDDVVFTLDDKTVVTRHVLDRGGLRLFQEMRDHVGTATFEYPDDDKEEAALVRAYIRWVSRFGYDVYTMTYPNPHDNDTVTVVTEDADAWKRFALDAFFQGTDATDPFAVYRYAPDAPLFVDTRIPDWYPLAPKGPVQ